ncbi:4_t:CDS:2, partial [Funneliformis geosporum]
PNNYKRFIMKARIIDIFTRFFIKSTIKCSSNETVHIKFSKFSTRFVQELIITKLAIIGYEFEKMTDKEPPKPLKQAWYHYQT